MFQLEHYLTPDGTDIIGEWLDGLTDHQATARLAARFVRLALGNFGDCKALSHGVWELRIDWGPGYRVYYAQAGAELLARLATEIETMKPSRTHEEWLYGKLKNARFAAAYLNAAAQDDDPRSYIVALRHVAEARGGLAKIASEAGVSRESLYRALSPRGNPTVKTLAAVLKAAGLRLAVRTQSIATLS